MNKSENLAVLRAAWATCEKCDLGGWRNDKPTVLGRGNPNAEYLFILDAPTQEDIGFMDGPLRPDSDMGALFLRLIETSGIQLSDCYFATLVGCEPLTYVPKTEEEEAHLKNRAPRVDESKVCRPRIEELIYIIDPRVIILCGERSYLDLLSSSVRGVYNTHMKGLEVGFAMEMSGRMTQVRYQTYAVHSPQAVDKNRSATAEHHPMRSIHRALSAIREYVEISA